LKKREIVLSIIILATFVLVMLCMIKISNIGCRLSELQVERQHSCNMSVPATCVPTLPLKENEMNVTNIDSEQDQLQVNDQLGRVNYSENIMHFQVCASQWLDGVITVRETLHCIDNYVRKINDSIQKDGNRDN